MRAEHIFPAVLSVLYLGAGLTCAYRHDWPRALYWWAAIIMNVVVTFGIGKS